MVKQISVFMENKGGRLAMVTRLLSENYVDIRALSVADTADFGILRLIVSDAEKAVRILKEQHIAASSNDVLAVELMDKLGALASVLTLLEEKKRVVEYAYAFITREVGKAYVILRCGDNLAAEAVLREAGIPMLDEEALKAM